MLRHSPDTPFAVADTYAFRAADAPAKTAARVLSLAGWGGLVAQKCWPRFFPLGSFAALPVAARVVRSDDRVSPKSARTSSAATWQSTVLNARFPRRAKPVARAAKEFPLAGW